MRLKHEQRHLNCLSDVSARGTARLACEGQLQAVLRRKREALQCLGDMRARTLTAEFTLAGYEFTLNSAICLTIAQQRGIAKFFEENTKQRHNVHR